MATIVIQSNKDGSILNTVISDYDSQELQNIISIFTETELFTTSTPARYICTVPCKLTAEVLSPILAGYERLENV